MMERASPAQNQPDLKSPPQSFSSWLYSKTSLFVSHLFALLSIAALITSPLINSLDTSERISGYITAASLRCIIFIAHILFILFCIIYLLLIRNVNNTYSNRVVEGHARIFGARSRATLKRSQRLLKEFKTFFLFFWFSMLALYCAFLFIEGLKERSEPEHTASLQPKSIVEGRVESKWSSGRREVSAQDLLIEVTEVRIPVEPAGEVAAASGAEQGQAEPDAECQRKAPAFKQKLFSDRDWRKAFIHILPEFIPFVLNTISLMFVFWCLTIVYLPYQNAKERGQQRRLLHFSIFLTVALICCFPLLFNRARVDEVFNDSGLLEYVTVFNGASGTLNAVVLALLIARLDSKLIGLPSRLVSILYLYAAVQPLFVVFSQPGLVNEAIKTFVLLSVFILKIYFFLIIMYAMQTGRMLNYLYCFPSLNSRVKSMFDNRFEITIQKGTPRSFDFIITRNRDLIYQTDHVFHSREACLSEVNRIQALMADRDSYRINPVGHTFTVEVWDTKLKRCFSTDQASRDEAEELILESIDSVPYCRLNKSSS